jgi:hypothetical protein
LSLRLSKTFSFGKEVARPVSVGGGGGGGGGFAGGSGFGGRGIAGGGGGRSGIFGPGNTGTKRFNLTFSAYARNVLNNVNLGTLIGVIGSRLFDQSDSLGGVFGGPGGGGSQAANRRIDFQITFSF